MSSSDGKSKWWNLKRRSLPVDTQSEEVRVVINELHTLLKKRERRKSIGIAPTLENVTQDNTSTSTTSENTTKSSSSSKNPSPTSENAPKISPTNRTPSPSPPTTPANPNPNPTTKNPTGPKKVAGLTDLQVESGNPENPLSPTSTSGPKKQTRPTQLQVPSTPVFPTNPQAPSFSPPPATSFSPTSPTNPLSPTSTIGPKKGHISPGTPSSSQAPSSPSFANHRSRERRASISISMSALPLDPIKQIFNAKKEESNTQLNAERKRRGSIFSEASASLIQFRRSEMYTPTSSEKKMLEDEVNYVQSLTILIKEFLTPLREQEILTRHELEDIFICCEPFLAIHSEIVKDLQNFTPAARAYQKMTQTLRHYTIFSEHEVQRWSTIGKCKKSNPLFSDHLKNCASRGYSLTSLLDQPIAHLGKCITNFKNYHAEPDIQGQPIQHEAQTAKIQIYACHASALENLERISLLRRFCTVSPLFSKISHITGTSEIIKEVEVICNEKPHSLILFSDFLLLLCAEAQSGFELVAQAALSDVTPGNVNESILEVKIGPTSFALDFPSPHHISQFLDLVEFQCRNAQDSKIEEEDEATAKEKYLCEIRAYRQREESLDALIASLEYQIETSNIQLVH